MATYNYSYPTNVGGSYYGTGIILASNEYMYQYRIRPCRVRIKNANNYSSSTTLRMGIYITGSDHAKNQRIMGLLLNNATYPSTSNYYEFVEGTDDCAWWNADYDFLGKNLHGYLPTTRQDTGATITGLTIIDPFLISISTKYAHNVTIAKSPFGSATANATTNVKPGATVKLTATAASGCTFSGWATSTPITISNNTFTMPDNDVTVMPIFTKSATTTTVHAGRYDASAFIPCNLKYYTGTAWVDCTPYYYNGSAWIPAITL